MASKPTSRKATAKRTPPADNGRKKATAAVTDGAKKATTTNGRKRTTAGNGRKRAPVVKNGRRAAAVADGPGPSAKD